MAAKPKPESGKDVGNGHAVGVRQRRALARLGLASASAYAAPTLLALRSAARGTNASGDTVTAA